MLVLFPDFLLLSILLSSFTISVEGCGTEPSPDEKDTEPDPTQGPLPTAATQAPPPGGDSRRQTNCGHSKYWNTGDLNTADAARIVGGVPAKPNEFPFQARIKWVRNPRQVCGGSILSSTFIMSAAHCCASNVIRSVDDVVMVVGDHNKSKVDKGEKEYQVAQIISHPKYNFYTNEYDFCLIRLKEELTWTEEVQTICLPRNCDEECKSQDDDKAYISGWGAASEDDSSNAVTQEILQKALVPIANINTCKANYGNSTPPREITDNMVCAGYKSGGIDSCQGDSGGPLTCFKNGYYQLDGVTSFGIGCARAKLFGVYARVCKELKWIKATMESKFTSTANSTGSGSDDTRIIRAESDTTVRTTTFKDIARSRRRSQRTRGRRKRTTVTKTTTTTTKKTTTTAEDDNMPSSGSGSY